jgi:hypothetical protein
MKLRYGKRSLGWTLALGALAVLLCITPLFNVLAYEFCLALALAAAFAGAHLGAARVWQERHGRAPSDGQRADAHPLRTVASLYMRAVGQVWALLALPLLLVLGNALRVRNCDLAGGLGWFFMLPMLSGACGAALGLVVAIAKNYRRRVVPTLLAIGAIIGSLAWGVWRFYAAPPIFGFDPFVGYFAGTLYDEDIAITSAFVWARLYHLSVALTFLALAALLLDGETLSLRRAAARGRGRLLILPIIAVFATGLMVHNRARLGFQLDAGDIARALGAEKRTAHFILHYSPRGPYAKDIDAFASDDELRWTQLEKFFGQAPPPPVHAFLFDNANDKRRLMGAAQTFIAKPWRREIYLQHDGWPQTVTMHELAHVFAGQFGDRLFGIARAGLHFNVGLIEGIAVAASWSGTPLTPHQVSRLLLDRHVVGPEALAEVMSPRFFGLNAGQAYNLAGSFVRFLVDNYGVQKMEALFHAAGSDDSYRRIYGKGFAQLRDEWQAALAREEVPPAEGAMALAWLKRPSVFHRACAHAIAAARQQAHATAAAGDRAGALAQFQALCRDEPGDAHALADALDAALAAEARPTARQLAHQILERRDPVLDGKAEMALGDLALLDEDVTTAQRHYTRAAGLPSEEGTARLITAKETIAAWPPGPMRTALAQFLAVPPAQHDQALDLMTLRGIVDAMPERALPHYLLARQLLGKGRWAEVVAELTHATSDTLPDARFEREARRVLGQAQLRLGHFAAARALFDALAHDPAAGTGARLEAEDWRARVDFAEHGAAATGAATGAANGATP